MDPTQYGPHAWVFLHATAGSSIEEHKRVAFAQWMKLLPAAFPCNICGEHLRQTMQAYPIERFMDSAESLLKYTYILHDAANNYVNSSHPDQPRKISPPWEQVKDMYLSIPTPEPVAPASVPLPAITSSSSNRAPRGGSRMTISHPAFQQLKSNFASAPGRRW